MTRDYWQFLPPSGLAGASPHDRSPLEQLGWQPFFAQQISVEDMARTPPVRVVEVHRNGLHILGDGFDALVPPGPDATVGDWLLLNRSQPASSKVLHRKSLFKRRAPKSRRKFQLIAANVDTAFVVSSCNEEFNVPRLERYFALAFEAGVTFVIVLTKIDLCEDPTPYSDAASAISQRVPVVLLNALGDEPKGKLRDWCKPGQTVAFLGSSGVGKSTLVNALLGDEAVDTAPIREDDARGRHTTSRRQLYFLPNGCAVLDTPGMRELQLTDTKEGIADVFSDLSDLADQCRFSDCKHETEPGCAIRAALETGVLDQAQLARWSKLVAEERFNSASLAKRKSKDNSLHKTIRAIQKQNRK